MMKILKVFM